MMSSEEKEYHRSDIAKQQLRTAVILFLNEKDLSSVITLSSAANNILYQLVINANKEPFINYAQRVHDAFNGWTPQKEKYRKYINDIFGVNVHKHMGRKCAETCTIDLHSSAENILLIAISEYIKLYGQTDDFVYAFLHWKWQKADGRKIAQAIRDMPEKLKKTEQWRKQFKQEDLSKEPLIEENKTTPKTYQRFQLAAKQLETAIMLFLTEQDRLSAITLSGAADVIFCELVNRQGKKNYTDILASDEGSRRSREELGREINDLLYINSLKHFDNGDEEYIKLDVSECAVAAILKALVNYNMLDGKDDNLIIAFRYWVKMNLDPERYDLKDK
ncbi:hypothetical protein [Legionella sp. km772]|uniref:hypothetical protein n=1 Tax=Legionella sp. km772 TaxID=2498111 RepID=UPI000F8E2A77|nr:hypothetical protein [Legionella sp. km772]RUR09115.1 hypothetical protein ELY15_09640 [Legionella sp. km772]